MLMLVVTSIPEIGILNIFMILRLKNGTIRKAELV